MAVEVIAGACLTWLQAEMSVCGPGTDALVLALLAALGLGVGVVLSSSSAASSANGGVFRPLVNSTTQCSNVSSIRFTLDMLLGTWYVVEVLPGPPPQGCEGFQLVSLNASSRKLQSEAFIISRFQRSADGYTVYDNRTLLIDSNERDTLASAMYDQLAMTDYSPDGKYLSLTVCRGGENWTYVYGRDQQVSRDDLHAIHQRLSQASVINGTADINNSSLCVW